MTEFLAVGDRRIAVERRTGRQPGLFWLGGFRSDMTGSKALALDRFGAQHGLAVTRFDYSGHGQTGGDFDLGTISRWLEEALAVFETTGGPQIVIGSSMGGWLALLLIRELRRRSASRVMGLVLIAPATDMTELMLAQMAKKYRTLLLKQGYVDEPSEYSPDPYRITLSLIEDGRQHLMLGRIIETGCPVTILQGARDKDVPKEHALKLVQHIVNDPVTFTLVPDGDHRLSREQDIALLERTIEGLLAD
ncbi:MAG: alpha/beta hydrolase [Devosia sp.]|jgi:pimeloyl-ACP methyl ester carboxylesterase|uniref:alpha/beta hydrolase n=1 Tax=Devosia sp. 66-22 TaxID=1895753 RepID=UPI00092B645A|nr:alpha/beta hydrolase [Devosia sp. 66-22]MBN9346158.1 alpha/beta hydrolase [Devosia sp.]OJX49266.1 MAG: alpha/beta hydrolase [Devosia sp. 66-22]